MSMFNNKQCNAIIRRSAVHTVMFRNVTCLWGWDFFLKNIYEFSAMHGLNKYISNTCTMVTTISLVNCIHLLLRRREAMTISQ